MNLVDPDGEDIWELNQKGIITWKEVYEDNWLFYVDNLGFRQDVVQIQDRAILDKFSQSDIGVVFYSSSISSKDIKKLFVFLSNHTSIEWALHKSGDTYTLGTVHSPDSSGNWEMFGVLNRPQISYHSHPGINPNMADEVYSMSVDYDNMRRFPKSKAENYYVYFPNSGYVYYLSPNGYRKISSIYKMLGISQGTIH